MSNEIMLPILIARTYPAPTNAGVAKPFGRLTRVVDLPPNPSTTFTSTTLTFIPFFSATRRAGESDDSYRNRLEFLRYLKESSPPPSSPSSSILPIPPQVGGRNVVGLAVSQSPDNIASVKLPLLRPPQLPPVTTSSASSTPPINTDVGSVRGGPGPGLLISAR